jgi:hypothetical protein
MAFDSTAFKTVELFGTLIKETKKAYLFAVEDETEIWLGKRICDWDGLTMSMPKWLARKRGFIVEPPGDEHPAWNIILKPTPTFFATSIKKGTPE